MLIRRRRSLKRSLNQKNSLQRPLLCYFQSGRSANVKLSRGQIPPVINLVLHQVRNEQCALLEASWAFVARVNRPALKRWRRNSRGRRRPRPRLASRKQWGGRPWSSRHGPSLYNTDQLGLWYFLPVLAGIFCTPLGLGSAAAASEANKSPPCSWGAEL